MTTRDDLPPYLRIAAEIRRRITTGALAPGDRVPSTRQIAREWGVALTTATRALTVLRQEGVVWSRPRSGTVVAGPPPGPTRTTRPGRRPDGDDPTRGRIVRAAVEIADAEGLSALSMRGVAARLGVAPMSLYRHVTSKDDLVVLMADAAFGELGYPDELPSGWRARVELAGRTLWALYRRHPWLAHVNPLTRPLPLPNLTAHTEVALAALQTLPVDLVTAYTLDILLYSYVVGMAVNLERETQEAATSGLSEEQWMDAHLSAFAAIAASGRYPAFGRTFGHLVQTGFDLDIDGLFERGLRLLLDGVESFVASTARP